MGRLTFTLMMGFVALVAFTMPAFIHPPVCSTDLFRLDTLGLPWRIVGILYHGGGWATITLYRNDMECSLRTNDAATIAAFERQIHVQR